MPWRAFGTVPHMRRLAAYAIDKISDIGNDEVYGQFSPVTKQDKCDLVFNKCHKDYLQNVSTTGPLLPRL